MKPLTLASATTRSDHEQAQLYAREGWALGRHRFTAARMAEARASLDMMIAALKPGQRPEGLVEPHVKAMDAAFWLDLCRDQELIAEVQATLGCRELILLMSHLIVKPAGDGKAVAWHQDITYWPSVKGTDITTVWLALDDVDVGNACMQVIPRTHAERERMEKIPTGGKDLLGVRVAVKPEDEARAVAVELDPGAYSLHDSFIIHGSGPNTSPRRRDGYTMRYGDATRVQVDLARHHVPVYYVAGDGTSFKPGTIDLR